MVTGFRVKSLFRPKFLLVAVLLAGLLFSGCTGRGVAPRGWSGVTASGGNVFLGTMDGRIVSLNTANNTLAWTVTLQNPATGGGFGCSAPSSVPVVFYSTPAVDGELVYVTGYNGKDVIVGVETTETPGRENAHVPTPAELHENVFKNKDKAWLSGTFRRGTGLENCYRSDEPVGRTGARVEWFDDGDQNYSGLKTDKLPVRLVW